LVLVATVCPKCGAETEQGFATAEGLIGGAKADGHEGQLIFVVAGVPTSQNPIAAFTQGVVDEPDNRAYRIAGVRCPNCGLLELYGNDFLDE
jgi:predicted nucleic-acid-binding Zn-ribbon protein